MKLNANSDPNASGMLLLLLFERHHLGKNFLSSIWLQFSLELPLSCWFRVIKQSGKLELKW